MPCGCCRRPRPCSSRTRPARFESLLLLIDVGFNRDLLTNTAWAEQAVAVAATLGDLPLRAGQSCGSWAIRGHMDPTFLLTDIQADVEAAARDFEAAGDVDALLEAILVLNTDPPQRRPLGGHRGDRPAWPGARDDLRARAASRRLRRLAGERTVLGSDARRRRDRDDRGPPSVDAPAAHARLAAPGHRAPSRVPWRRSRSRGSTSGSGGDLGGARSASERISPRVRAIRAGRLRWRARRGPVAGRRNWSAWVRPACGRRWSGSRRGC